MQTGQQREMLQAMISGDFDRQDELSKLVTQKDEWAEYAVLIAAAFYLGVRRTMSGQPVPAGVMALVADIRERFDPDGTSYDPRSMELLMLSALGDDVSTEHISNSQVIGIQAVVVGALGVDEKLGDADEFVDRAAKLADKWAAA